MTRDSLSTTQYAHKIIHSLKPLFKGLPPSVSYISIFKKYSEYILKHRAAIHYATEYLPILAALIVIQVERDLDHAHEITEMRKQYAQELCKLREEMDQLRRDMKSLTSHD
jgi:hypothetical protein